MAYKPTAWVDGETPVNAENLNKMERGIADAVVSVNGKTPDENGNVEVAGGSGGNVDLTGYATEEFVKNKIAEAELGGGEVDLSGYAQKSELPTKVSQLENDKGYLTEHQDISGKLDASALPTAINTALAQAKASGEFNGKDGTSVTVKAVAESTADGGINMVTFSDGKTLNIKNGSKGSTPVRGIDYWTEADKEAILHEVMQALATPVYGRVDEENNIIITAELADGTYTLKYENADGKKVDIGSIELGSNDVVVDESGPIVIEWAGGVKLDKNSGGEGSGSNYGASQSIAYDSTYQYTIATTNNYATQAAICWYGDSGYLGWNDAIAAGATPGSQSSAILNPLDGATSFRVRAYTIHSDATNRDEVLAYISVRKDLIQ